MLTMVWLQSEITNDYVHLLTIFVGLVALALSVQAIAIVVLAIKALSIIKDLKASLDEIRHKAMPVVAKISELTTISQGIVADLAPKVKLVTENVVEMSHTVRQTISKLDVTIRDAAGRATSTLADVDSRTKVQVARVDSMVATTLAATAELGATINEGIRVPARKLAVLVNQSKHLVETLLDRVKALASIRGGTATSGRTKLTKTDW